MTDSAARPDWSTRSLTERDWEQFLRVDSHAFGATMPEELGATERELHEEGRGLGAFDRDDELVGIATAFSYDLSVPGAEVPAAGVSWVGVLPTHRRRGVLTALMRAQLHGIRDAGREPIAILWASEPQIYGRFGYGQATSLFFASVRRDPRALHALAPVDPALRLRLTEPAQWKDVAEVYEGLRARRPGMPARDERWWRRAVRDVPALRHGYSELRAVLAEDPAGVRGYAYYATKQGSGENFANGTVAVREVIATDPAALAALYRYLFDLDLMGKTELNNLPFDDPLPHWLTDPRQARLTRHDALYVRLVDLPGALTARRYAAELDVVLEVADGFCPWNAGRWRLCAGPEGTATCTPADSAPDLRLDVRELGAIYLGGTSLLDLAGAGLADERTAGAAQRTARAFAHHPAPWSPAVF